MKKIPHNGRDDPFPRRMGPDPKKIESEEIIMCYSECSKEELRAELARVKSEYEELL